MSVIKKRARALGRTSLCAAVLVAVSACGGGSAQDDAPASVPAGAAASSEAPVAGASSLDNMQAQLEKASGDSFVVVMNNGSGADPEVAAQEAAMRFGGQVTHVYNKVFRGYSIAVPDTRVEAFVQAMGESEDTDLVEPDQERAAEDESSNEVSQLEAPWGLERIAQRTLPLRGDYRYQLTGAGVTAYIVDGGIHAAQKEFAGRILPGFSAIDDGRGTEDCRGHGTHVAGTVGGTTWGVAKQVNLVPVRVLRCAGGGRNSDVIAGLDWVLANARLPAVINMSLGSGPSTALDAAVDRVSARGIVVVVSAGNDNGNACFRSPAREPSAITVGAVGSKDLRASFSNYGGCVDLFAPGVNIRSAALSDTGSALKSGTSMSAPHVTGAVALALQARPHATAAEIQALIKATATADKVVDVQAGSPNLLLYTRDLGRALTAPAPMLPVQSVAVADLAARVLRQPAGWRALVEVSVQGAKGERLAGARVTGSFSVGGSKVSCTTGTDGKCTVASGSLPAGIRNSTFTVTDVVLPGYTYDVRRNAETKIAVSS